MTKAQSTIHITDLLSMAYLSAGVLNRSLSPTKKLQVGETMSRQCNDNGNPLKRKQHPD